jgi:AraC-like DNA-binding protein
MCGDIGCEATMDLRIATRQPPAEGLTYDLLAANARVEASFWRGTGGPDLSGHFHDEVQFTFVLAGRRRFALHSRIVDVDAGEFIVVPALMPHKAVGLEAAATSIDVFWSNEILPCSVTRRCGVYPMPGQWLSGGVVNVDDLYEIASAHTSGSRRPRSFAVTSREMTKRMVSTDAPIVQIAAEARMSREGFIRLFLREVGITPHAYRVARRLCDARTLLRRGAPPALVAAETGFADQSHLGRLFRKAFGTSPAEIRKIWKR